VKVNEVAAADVLLKDEYPITYKKGAANCAAPV
jgi:hypothetical protein